MFGATAMFLYAVAGQTVFSGLTTMQTQAGALEAAKRECKMHAALTEQQQLISESVAQGYAIEPQSIDDRIAEWRNIQDDLDLGAHQMRQQFRVRFATYLVFLGAVTVLLFLAALKKAGRLHKLFRKIDQITSAPP